MTQSNMIGEKVKIGDRIIGKVVASSFDSSGLTDLKIEIESTVKIQIVKPTSSLDYYDR